MISVLSYSLRAYRGGLFYKCYVQVLIIGGVMTQNSSPAVSLPSPSAAFVSEARRPFESLEHDYANEIRHLVNRYAAVNFGNLWADDIRQTARIALWEAVKLGLLHETPAILATEPGPERDALRRSIAYRHMQHAIEAKLTGLMHGGSITRNTLRRYRQLAAAFEAKLGAGTFAEATGAEVVSVTGCSPCQALRALWALRSPVRLDAPTPDGQRREDPADPEARHPLGAMITRESISELGRALAALSPERRELVVRYCGLDGHEATTATALAKRAGCTRQSVQERLDRALAELRRQLA